MSDLIELLRRLRAPAALVDLLALTYRATFVLLASLERLRAARAPAAGPGAGVGAAALLASQLLLDAYRRGVQLELALERGSARLPPAPSPIAYATGRAAWWLGAALTGSLLLAGLAG